MRAVTYSRYSSANQRETSIADQQRNCVRYAEREGWKISKRYADKAISGSIADRPGYQRLLSDGKAGRFDVLLVDDLSRLSRDDIEFKKALRHFVTWGVRVIGVSDGYDSAQKGHKLQAGVRGLMNELYLDDLREKTHRGLTGRALAGLNTGGRVFGYRNVPIEDPKRRDEYGRPLIIGARKEIDEEQARWVRFIFERFSHGDSVRTIAAALNAKGVKAPRGHGWSGTALYGNPSQGTGILNNEIYIGRLRWNRSQWQKDPETGRAIRRERPQAEWIVKDAPELRVIDDRLWQAVKARQAETRTATVKLRERLRSATAKGGRKPKYLFSGLLVCETCGSPYSILDGRNYGCSAHYYRGACQNGIKVARKVAEARLLAAIRSDLFTEETLDDFKVMMRRVMRERLAAHGADTEVTRLALAKAEAEVANIMRAIRAGILTPTVKAELEKAEADRARLARILKLGTEPIDDIEGLLAKATDRFHEVVGSLETRLTPQMSRARNLVGALVGGSIKLVPSKRGGLAARLRGDYAGLVQLIKENGPSRKAGTVETLVAGRCNQLCLLLAAERLPLQSP